MKFIKLPSGTFINLDLLFGIHDLGDYTGKVALDHGNFLLPPGDHAALLDAVEHFAKVNSGFWPSGEHYAKWDWSGFKP